MNSTSLRSRSEKPTRTEHKLDFDPVVGKDILELLSSAMYLDPRSIYREYLQNAADAIDDAFAVDLFDCDDLARVEIAIDVQARSVRIRDNGCGVSHLEAERVLTSFGASGKRGKSARGFRGVGRLAAFGYAQVVSFKTKAAGETVATEVRWDCRKLKEALLDQSYKADLKQIVRDVVTVAVEADENAQAHYFEVTLEKVVRIKNDTLLNDVELTAYLSEVVPVPFHNEFRFGAEIERILTAYVPPCRFRIFINGSADPITKPHRNHFALSAAKTDSVLELEPLHLKGSDGSVSAVGWLLHHNYLGAIHAHSELRGLRARVGDIQIGSDDIFGDAFLEPRFNSWTIGEINIVDRRIVPNGRRDGFEPNAAYNDLYSQIALVTKRQSTRCRQSSARRNRLRGFEAREQKVQELLTVLVQHGTSKPLAIRAKKEIGAAVAEMKRLTRSSMINAKDSTRLTKRIKALESRFDGISSIGELEDPFAEASPAKRSAYEEMIDLIYDCSPNRAAARSLVDRILTRFISQTIRIRRKKGAKAGRHQR